jgi:hypothetical protein
MTVKALAVRQNVLREANERISRLRWTQADGETIGYLCECSRVDCAETIALDADAYDAVRASPLRFLLLPGHDQAGVERVVEHHADYVVVENIGEAAEIARAADPRAKPESPDPRASGSARLRRRGWRSPPPGTGRA